jgi:tellurite resistance protein
MNADAEGLGRQLGGNKEFLEAVVAVCALMANADDDVVLCERSSISAAIATDRDFEHFDKNVVDQLLEEYIRALQEEKQSAKAKFSSKVMQMYGNKGKALALMRLAYRVMVSDHQIEDSEREEFRGLCLILDLDPEFVFDDLAAGRKGSL